jgi:predicted ArsR family transcriptional regulator
MKDLFDWAAQCRRESNEKVARALRERQVMEALRGFPDGATAQELAHALRWDKTSVRPRLTELQEDGLISMVGRRTTPFSAKSCTVYKVA